MGTGSGMRTHSCSKRTLGVAGASSDSDSETVAVERETKEGERGRTHDMMAVKKEEGGRTGGGRAQEPSRLN